MRGFPKYLNTKQDYLNCLEEFPTETKEELKRLLASRFVWKDTAVLASEEAGVQDDTHRIIKSEDGNIQQELVEDDRSELIRVGFTVEEIEELLK